MSIFSKICFRNLLKNEAEQALNGKQWLLSCFGPFKESPVVPNFITDQCFEEVRLGFLENSKNGNIQNYLNNLMSEYNNALRKMNEIKMPSNETLQIFASVYNSSGSEPKNTAKPASQTQNPFQSSNIFGGSNQQQQQGVLNSSSIFGGTSSNNPFQQAPQQTSMAATGAQQSPFSFSQNSQPKPSIFGSSQPSQTSSIFGSSNPQPQTNASIFGGQPTNPQQQSNASIFGGQSNIFAQTTGSNVFGMSTNQPASSIFGSSTMQQPTQNTQQSIFGAQTTANQTMQSSAPANQNIFGSFGQTNPSFAQTTSSFGAQQAPPAPQNIFQQAQQAPAAPQNVFQVNASATQNVFSQFQTAPSNNSMTQEPPQIQTNIFGAAQPVEQPAQVNPSPFQIQQSQAPSSNVFGGNPFQAPVKANDEHFYSKQEELSAEDIQAFQAETFTLGKIPLLPPTKALALV